jgi:hypothetical protein
MKIDNLDETFNKCISQGIVKEKFKDIELIKSLKLVAEKSITFIEKKSKDIPKNSDDWTFVFRDYYESLRNLIEAFLLFENISVDNHQCKNAYICFKHKELILNWEFLETIRLKRNAINYRGQLLNYDDWKQLELNFKLHINVLKEKIEEKLK